MSMDSLEERQEQEVEVLKAIYLEDFQDLRERDVWKVKRPPEFTLRLTPNHDSNGRILSKCSAVLRIKFSTAYPLDPPAEIDVHDAEGLNNLEITELKAFLKEKAGNLVGEVMVTELAQLASSWLSKHGRKVRFGSFYEEMEAKNQELNEKEKQRQAEVKELNAKMEAKELQAIRDEVAEKKEAMRNERKKRREEAEKLRSDSCQNASANGTSTHTDRRRNASSKRRNSSSVSCSDSIGPSGELEVVHDQLKLVLRGENVTLQKLSRLGSNVLGGTVFLGKLSSYDKLVAVAEWSFRTRRVGNKKDNYDEAAVDGTQLAKQIHSIEQELTQIQKVSHPNVIHYVGIAQISSASHIKLFIIQDFIHGTNLSFYLSENIPMDLDILRYHTIGILTALAFMHDNNFVHRDLRDSSVFVDGKGVIKVGDFSIDKRVRDLRQETKETGDERFPISIGRGGKKVDIFRLGLLVLSLALGEISQEPIVPKGLPPDFTDFLRKALNRDERERWNAAQLLKHSWLHQTIERSPLRHLSAKEEAKCLSNLDENDENREAEDGDEEADVTPVPFTSVGTGQSRLQNEFSFISYIGKGGFGEVMKVKNNLDGQIYAIKKIKLNPKNKQATKKLMREVKLLSRLNHENVVRYYTSWIEVTTIKEESRDVETSFADDEDASTSRDVSFAATKITKKKKSLLDNIVLKDSMFGDDRIDADVNLSFSSRVLQDERGVGSSSDSSDEENSDSDEDIFGTSFLPNSSAWTEDDSEIVFRDSKSTSPVNNDENQSQSIVFEEGEDDHQKKDESVSDSEEENTESKDERKIEIRLMYIQMEFCDKQTLRSAIDAGLYKDMQRVWRMFREIIEGLVHIHTQAMIHRDLKPVNIFLDHNDHVKIGDFGLATSNVLDTKSTSFAFAHDSLLDVDSDDMTGQIGTALYIAPEITSSRTASYTQKVDIYSLGIIFFEMCYSPLQTGMERIKILTELRKPEIKIPSDFCEGLMMQQRAIIKWLLDHDPTKRPNSQELLQSDYLPPPVVEEAELQEMVRHTLSNQKSKAYRHLIDSCLAQSMTLAQDISFDMEITRDMMKASSKRPIIQTLNAQEYVRRTSERVFQRHGAISVQWIHLLPKCKNYQIYDRSGVVHVMTRSGGVVTLPYDLRVAFARFVARAQLNNLKRYCIAPVFREYQIYGYHPREQLELDFDIITSTEGSLLADAEVLYTTDELLREMCPGGGPAIHHFFRLNHTSLLKGIMLNSGIPEDYHGSVYSVMRDGANWTKLQRTTNLINLGLSETVVTSFLNVLEHEGSPSVISGILRHLIRKKNAASSSIKTSLNELEDIISKAASLGVKCSMVISPSLVYNPGHFSGMICQLVRRKRKGNGTEIMAAGGRYDDLLRKFSSNISLSFQEEPSLPKNKDFNQSGVGISLSMDKLVSIVLSEKIMKSGPAEVFIYSENHTSTLLKEKFDLAHKLWNAGVKSVLCDIYETIEEIQDRAQDIFAGFVVILRESDARIRCLDNDRFQEKKVPLGDVADFLITAVKQRRGEERKETAQSASGIACSTNAGGTSSVMHRSDSIRQNNVDSSKNLNVHVNYNFRFLDKHKMTTASKKRLESTISSKVTPVLHMLASNTVVEVVALSLPKSVIKSMAAILDFEDERLNKESVTNLIEKHTRYRKELSSACDEIQLIRFEKLCSVIILYSCDDHCYSTLLAV